MKETRTSIFEIRLAAGVVSDMVGAGGGVVLDLNTWLGYNIG